MKQLFILPLLLITLGMSQYNGCNVHVDIPDEVELDHNLLVEVGDKFDGTLEDLIRTLNETPDNLQLAFDLAIDSVAHHINTLPGSIADSLKPRLDVLLADLQFIYLQTLGLTSASVNCNLPYAIENAKNSIHELLAHLAPGINYYSPYSRVPKVCLPSVLAWSITAQPTNNMITFYGVDFFMGEKVYACLELPDGQEAFFSEDVVIMTSNEIISIRIPSTYNAVMGQYKLILLKYGKTTISEIAIVK